MRILFIICSFYLCLLSTSAQVVTGKITSSQSETIPYATIFVKESNLGTTSNTDGIYEIHLSESGTYHISFQMLGFQKQEITINIGKGETLTKDIVLEVQSYELSEVKVDAGKEDPAYAIMRRVISLAPYYKNQVNGWKSQVYLKGSLIFNNLPFLIRKQLEVNGAKVEEGKCYTLESLNEIEYQTPDIYKHTVLNSRTTFPKTDENNPIGLININLYDAQFDNIISPLAPTAFKYYKFTYEGFFKEGHHNVFKIKITPRMDSQQLVSGTVYIVDNLWCIHSADITYEPFFGTINLRQIFTQIDETMWLPGTHLFSINASVMGIKAVTDYVGSVKYLNVDKNKNLQIPAMIQLPAEAPKLTETVKQPSENEKKLQALMSKEKMTNRDVVKMTRLMEAENKKTQPRDTTLEIKNNYHFKVQKDTTQRDSAFWNAMRPIPLTPIETKSFKTKDSLTVINSASTDSTKSQSKKNKFGNTMGAILTGHTFQNSDTTLTLHWNGLAGTSLFGFNPVEGFWYKQKALLTYKPNPQHPLWIEPMVMYGFAREKLSWNLHSTYCYAPMKRGYVWLDGGSASHDFQSQGTSVFINTVYNLFLKENYINLYDKQYVTAAQNIDIANGLQLTTEANYINYSQLHNNTNFSFLDKDNPYPDNTPQNMDDISGNLTSQREFSTNVKLSYTPQYHYRIKDGVKHMIYSNWPTFELGWQQGYKTLNSDAAYSHLWTSITQEKRLALFASINYQVNAGWFPQNESMHFSAFKSFSTIATIIDTKPMKYSFALLDNYLYSTNRSYLQAHFNYSTPFLVLKRLPFFSNRLWNENIYVHYLTQPSLKNYTEVGYGISQILFAGEAAVVSGFENGEYKSWGIKLSWKF